MGGAMRLMTPSIRGRKAANRELSELTRRQRNKESMLSESILMHRGRPTRAHILAVVS